MRAGRGVVCRAAWWIGAVVWAWPGLAQGQEASDEARLEASAGEAVSGEEGEEGEVVVVTGTRTPQRRSESPVATEVLTREDIRTSGAENLADLLEEHAGVEVVRGLGGAGVRLQGMDPKYVLILVDGQRVGGRVDGTLDLGRFSVERVEQVEIVRGASTSLYGADALGGVVNIITKQPVEPVEASGSASLGEVGRQDVRGSVAARGEVWDGEVAGSWHRRAAFDLDPSEPSTTGSGWDAWSVSGQAKRRLGGGDSASGQVEYLRRDTRGVDAHGGGAVVDRRNLTETLAVSARPELGIGAGGVVRGMVGYALFRDQLLEDQRGAAELDRVQETVEQSGQATAQVEVPLGGGHRVTVGGEGYAEGLRSERLEGGAGLRWRWAALVQDVWTVDEALTVVPGGRVDLDTWSGWAPTASLAVRWAMGESFALRAGGGRGWRAPAFKELLLLFENPGANYRVEGNPDLRPEGSTNLNLGGTWTPARGFEVNINAFYNDLEDLIGIETLEEGVAGRVSRYRYINIAAARTRGVESQARLRLWSGATAEVGYTLLDAEDRTAGVPLEGRPRHRTTAALTQRHARWGVEASARLAWTGERPFYLDRDGDGVAERFDAAPYASLDARLGWEVWGGAGIFLGGENLLNAGDAELLPLAPRRLYGGVTFNY